MPWKKVYTSNRKKTMMKTIPKKKYMKMTVPEAVMKKISNDVKKEIFGIVKKELVMDWNIGHGEGLMVYSQGVYKDGKYIRITVTEAIPLQRLAKEGPDERWRTRNVVRIKGVLVRFLVDYWTSLRLMGVCYRAKIEVSEVDNLCEPGARMIKSGDGEPNQRMMMLKETGIISESGPFMTINTPGVMKLNSLDDSLFTCYQSAGDGKPVGIVR
jgi:hypothetical protein